MSRWSELHALKGGLEVLGRLGIRHRVLPHPFPWLFHPGKSCAILAAATNGERAEVEARLLK